MITAVGVTFSVMTHDSDQLENYDSDSAPGRST